MKKYVKNCPCCKEDHWNLDIKLLKNPDVIEIQNKKYFYIVLCPIINEKIYFGSLWENNKQIVGHYPSIISFIQRNIIYPIKKKKVEKQKIQDEKERLERWKASKKWIETRKKESKILKAGEIK